MKTRTLREIQVRRLDEIETLISFLATILKPGAVLLLEGDLGAGKTEIVKRLARHWGLGSVASPTFAIHHRYEAVGAPGLDHVDLYRLEDEADLESTGFWDLVADESSYLFVEWAQRLDPSVFPRSRPLVGVRIGKGPSAEERNYLVWARE